MLKSTYKSKTLLFSLTGFLMPLLLVAQLPIKISENGNKEAFPLVHSNHASGIYVEQTDFPVANVAAKLFSEDIERVTGHKPFVYHNLNKAKDEVVIIGTIGKCKAINTLIEQRKLDVSTIVNKWESYLITTVINPFPGIKKALIIAGSDRRGTAFGVFSLSEAIGVSPWYWWADVTPFKHKQLYVKANNIIQGSPSVKYRGIFINDEDFGGLAIWAAKTFDPQTGNIGPKMYQKVFELLLRLKANYLWPAMHPGTAAFNSFPENAKLADDYGIVMGSSHCEIMLRNNEAEWKAVGTYGPYNFGTNRKEMDEYWEERVKANAKYENTYTIGLRGIHDTSMEGAETLSEQVDFTQAAIGDQRDILKKHVNKDLTKVLQVLCAYKEVLPIYQNGLKLPDDVTLMWADDNHGFIRQLSNPAEQKRRGGAGVYYHLAYHGDPESWLWLSSISPELIAYELGKAYQYKANEIWVFNVGDIKPAEKEISFAMDMAWNANKWTPKNANQYIKQWYARTFGDANSVEIASLMNEYYKLAATGKPEHIVWNEYAENVMLDRVKRYQAIRAKAIKIERQIPAQLKDAYYELILYPVTGAGLMNEYFFYARTSLIKVSNGDMAAMDDVQKSKRAYDELNEITDKYNHEIASGKWERFFNWRPYKKLNSSVYDLDTATLQKIEQGKKAIPPVTINLSEGKYVAPMVLKNGVIVNTADKRQTSQTGGSATFNWNSPKDGRVALWFKSITPIKNKSFKPEDNSFWQVKMNDSLVTGVVTPIGNIWHALAIGPIWNKIGDFNVHKGTNRLYVAQRDSGAIISDIYIGIQPPLPLAAKQVIAAGNFINKKEAYGGKIDIIPGLSEQTGIALFPYTLPEISGDKIDQACWVEYHIDLEKGFNHLLFKAVPTQRIHNGRHVRFAVSINGEKPHVMDIQSDEFSAEWQRNVLRGYAERSMDHVAAKTESVNLRIYLIDPGVILESINLY
ncbi:glycosyl hydrolase 115 family protein [Arcticibacter eurypsychrophilus]|uniref:glycosyl hydrolase 115 family protein n=1 Tax=Arcticibacter eurypsychrophilus TaxID=1434752 RepID=UPI00084D6DC9|nr:glycosyl hydrolase 115 family protein [Arcticibacter eurypsychrophilus]